MQDLIPWSLCRVFWETKMLVPLWFKKLVKLGSAAAELSE